MLIYLGVQTQRNVTDTKMNNQIIPPVVYYLGFFLTLFIISAHYATKVIDWLQRKKYLRYSDNSAEFVADLYKLKMKWAKRGEWMRVKAIDAVIGAEMMPDTDKAPQTEEGRQYIQKMKEMMAGEARGNADILE